MVLCRPGGRWMLGCCCWFLLFLILVPLLFLSGPMSSSVPPPVVSAAAAAGDRLRDFSLVLWCLSSGMDSHVSGMWTDGCWTLPHTHTLSLSEVRGRRRTCSDGLDLVWVFKACTDGCAWTCGHSCPREIT